MTQKLITEELDLSGAHLHTRLPYSVLWQFLQNCLAGLPEGYADGGVFSVMVGDHVLAKMRWVER